MKRTTKSLLLTALILFCVGVLLTLGSFLFVKIRGIDPYGIEKSLKTPEDKTVTLSDILANSPNSNFVKGTASVEFSSVELTSFSGKVVLKPTDGETRIELKQANMQNVSFEIVGETLTVKDTKPVGMMGFFVDDGGFSYHGLRQIFGPGNTLESNRVVTLYLNEETEVAKITLSSMVGDVEVDGIRAWQLLITVSVGDITAKNCTVSDRFEITGSFSDVNVADNHTASIKAETKVGTIEALLSQPETTSVNFDVWLGSVNVKTTEPTASYKMNFDTIIGGIYNNGEKLGKNVQTDATKAAKRVSASAIFGTIHFDYAYGKEPEVILPETEPETTEPATLPETETATAEAKP